MIIGAQFFTVRDFCRNLDDFAESLKKVADIGYTSVQISGTCGYEADWLAEQLKANGLHCGLTHFNFDRVLHDTDAVIAEHKTFGCKYIGLGCMPDAKIEGYKKLFEVKEPAKKIHDAGLQFMYHNHAFEYEGKMEDGRPLMHHMSEDFTPEEMGFTLDTYWVKYGGYDVIDEIKRLSGRVPVVHFKDMLITDDGEKRMSWVGGGNALNFEEIIPAFDAAGTAYAYVEQDNCYGEDPFVCLKKSYDYLVSLGLK